MEFKHWSVAIQAAVRAVSTKMVENQPKSGSVVILTTVKSGSIRMLACLT